MLCRDIFSDLSEKYDVSVLSRGEKGDEAFGLLHGRERQGMLCLSEDGALSCGAWRAQLAPGDSGRVADYLTDNFSELYRQSAKLEDLRSRVSRNEPLASVMDCAAELLGNPLILFDHSYRVIAYSHCEQLRDPLWEGNISRGYCTYDFIVGLNALVLDIPQSTPDAFEAPCDLSPRFKLCSRLFWTGIHMATILTLDSNRPVELWHRKVLPIISSELSKLLHESELYSSLIGSAGEIVLSGILEGESREISAERLLANSISLPDSLCCCAIKPKASLGSSSKQLLETQLRNIFPLGYVLAHEEWIALFFAAKYPDIVDKDKLEKVSRLFERYATLIGFSGISKSALEVRKAFREAQRAADIGIRLGTEGAVFYDDVKHFDLLVGLGDIEGLRRYQHPAIAILREYDAANDSELLPILWAYIGHGCNAKETAADLFMHRNTLNYRLSRISELGKISLDDSRTIYMLAFSQWIEQLHSASHQSQRV